MRTMIDLPDDLYRDLEARADRRGLSVRTLVRKLTEDGLRSSSDPKPDRPPWRELRR